MDLRRHAQPPRRPLAQRRRSPGRAGAVDLPEETIEEIAAAAGVDPHDELVRSEMEEALATAIAALPREQREVLRSQALEGSSFASSPSARVRLSIR